MEKEDKAKGEGEKSGIEPRRLVLRKVVIYTDKVERHVRIVHMSDVQSVSEGSYEREVFRRIKELKPDIVFHTGDLLQPVNLS
jgi:hypothetical protein